MLRPSLKSVVREGGANPVSGEASRQRLSPSLVLSKSARSFRISFLGRGDYVTIAKAYRRLAQERGWLITWDEKLKTNPEREKLFGAANIKLWSALNRRMNLESTREESARVNWTFDEAAQVAEHLKEDLKLDRVLFTVGGWIHRGYDNQHPDILPAAPECGGDTALADCARRVMRLGYLFCLHDNYQDIYRDSPSWDEKLIMKTRDGQLARGGHWAGGLAFLTCSQMALDLAKRPQNLMAVKKLCGANAYFINTTYAAGLQECFDPAHPLTRADDLKWKQALSDYAREVFGIFGSECGREWAIPHSDFFEGLTGVSGGYYHDSGLTGKLGATVVPLFELVYRDCIAMYGKYGYDPRRAAGYVLYHISLGRPLNYHSIPRHLYWKSQPPPQAPPTPAAGDPALFTRAEGGWAEGLHPVDRFIKNTCEVLCPLNEMTARLPMTGHQFLTPDRKVQRTVFGDGTGAVQVIVNSGTEAYVSGFEARRPGRAAARRLPCRIARLCRLPRFKLGRQTIRVVAPVHLAQPGSAAPLTVTPGQGLSCVRQQRDFPGQHPTGREDGSGFGPKSGEVIPLLTTLERCSRTTLVLACLAMLAVIGTIDYLTGYRTALSRSFICWTLGWRPGLWAEVLVC